MPGAILSVGFCILLHETQHLYKNKIGNVYVRILIAAGLSIALAFLFGRDYCGAGFNLVEKAVDGESAYLGFLLKMIFTAVALGGGFKGGESFPHWQWDRPLDVPSVCSQALSRLCARQPECSLPSSASQTARLLPCSSDSNFLGLRRCLILRWRFAISFTLSGYYGLYSGQKFTYSKTKAEFINRKAH